MSDFFLELGRHPMARKLLRQLGLPIPMPQPLMRSSAPWEARPLAGRAAVLGGIGGPGGVGSPLLPLCAEVLTTAGASSYWAGGGAAQPAGAHALDLPALPADLRADALVFDASGLTQPAELGALYGFFHPQLRALAPCGRVVVLGRPAGECDQVEQAAAMASLDGFVRSLAKELGKQGTTAQLVYVSRGAEERLPAAVRFLLSPRAAFMTGQTLTLRTTAAAPRETPLVRPLAGKIALVTGAARGIGAATARLMAAEGAHVICLDRPEDSETLSQIAGELGGESLLVDVSGGSAPQTICDALRERHGGVDIVVHNAGVTRDKTLARMQRDQWDQAIEINLGAVVRITSALLAQDLIRDGGRIICLSSVAGIAGNLGQTNYAASKAGIIGFIKHLAEPLGPAGITVNAVAPGFIETRLTEAMPLMIREVGRRLSALGQGGLPQDVAEVITFLATPGASGITGSVVRVCGGSFVGA